LGANTLLNEEGHSAGQQKEDEPIKFSDAEQFKERPLEDVGMDPDDDKKWLGEDNDDIDTEMLSKVKDPYVRKRSMAQRDADFRTVTVGNENLLKEG